MRPRQIGQTCLDYETCGWLAVPNPVLTVLSRLLLHLNLDAQHRDGAVYALASVLADRTVSLYFQMPIPLIG